MDIPNNEVERQHVLDQTELLNSPAEARFDRITRLTQQFFSVPITLVSLVDRDRQWFKSRQGLDAEETPRDISFCGHAILYSHAFVIEDALLDPRFCNNPLVTGAPHIRFYAGAPLTIDGVHIGTLCIIDSEPRDFPPAHIEQLLDFAAIVAELIQADSDSRKSRSQMNAELIASRDNMASVVDNMPGMTYRCLADARRTMLYISRQAKVISGYEVDDLMRGKHLCYSDLIHPEDISEAHLAIEKAILHESEWHIEYRLRHKEGDWRWVEERGKCLFSASRQTQMLEGFIVDISRERNALSQLSKHHEALMLLNNIAFQVTASLDEKIAAALAAARQYLKVEVAIVSEIEHDDYIVRWVSTTPAQIIPIGMHFPLQHTWCQLIFSDAANEHNERFIANCSGGEWHNHPCYQATPLGSYAGIVIEVNDTPFGTLNFSSSTARDSDFDASEKIFVRLLARWLSDLLTDNLNSERLIKLMAQLPGVTYQFRRYPDGRMTFPFSSPNIVQLYGITPEQALHDASLAFARIHPEDIPMVSDSIEHSATTLEYWQATYRVGSANEGYRWISGQARPERLLDGSTLWHGYLQDIHEQEQALLAIKENERRLRSLFDFSPIGIALNDYATGRFIDLNDALVAPTGYTQEEFVALSYWDVTPEEYKAKEEEALADLSTTGRYGPFEKEYIRKDGSRYPVRLQGMLSKDRDGSAVIWSLIEDITERRKLDKMKDQFVATVSHELRTPLTSITGALGLLLGGAAGPLPDKASTLLGTAERNAKRLANLINDLLDIEKLVAGKMSVNMTQQPLAPLLDEAMDAMSHYREQYQVRIQAPATWPDCQVNVDGPRLIHALTNLLSNAIKFSPDDANVEIRVEQDTDHIMIVIRDHGLGIDPAFRKHLFQRFSQADASDTRKLQGTGLGLAITSEICQLLNGHVEYRDANEGGAEFCISLPHAGLR